MDILQKLEGWLNGPVARGLLGTIYVALNDDRAVLDARDTLRAAVGKALLAAEPSSTSATEPPPAPVELVPIPSADERGTQTVAEWRRNHSDPAAKGK